ncbi:MAG: 4Fe-4S cluster-binding domain-containing protein [Ruminiclostridium sp.]|nr:4Fe-4S cluster-binding domain-containing protein [Ruminiclostridium sp.]
MHYIFKYPELFDGVERTDFRDLNGDIVIYGAGFQGLLTAFLLKKQNIDVICFADVDKRKQGTLYYGLPVISPEEMTEKYRDKTVIVTPYSLENVWEHLKNDLHLKNLVTPFSLFLDFYTDGFDKLPEIPEWYHPDTVNFNIERFLIKCVNVLTDHEIFCYELSVTERCSLRCRNCVSLMPCYEKPVDFNYNDLLNDILKLIENRTIYILIIEGGEPFLWKPLAEFLTELCKHSNIMRIYPITNGTIIPDKNLLKALSDPKITVRISDYGTYSKTDKLVSLFRENRIDYWLQLQIWNELSAYTLKEHNKEEMEKVILSCCKLQFTGGVYIKNGRLYICPNQGNLDELGIFKAEEGSFVDLRKENSKELQEEIDRFLRNRPVGALCRHCNGRGFTNKEVPPAEQLKPGEKINVRFE